MAVVGGLPVDGAKEVRYFDDGRWSEIEFLKNLKEKSLQDSSAKTNIERLYSQLRPILGIC